MDVRDGFFQFSFYKVSSFFRGRGVFSFLEGIQCFFQKFILSCIELFSFLVLLFYMIEKGVSLDNSFIQYIFEQFCFGEDYMLSLLKLFVRFSYFCCRSVNLLYWGSSVICEQLCQVFIKCFFFFCKFWVFRGVLSL